MPRGKQLPNPFYIALVVLGIVFLDHGRVPMQ